MSSKSQIMAQASELLAEHGVRWCFCEALWERTWDWMEAQASPEPSPPEKPSESPLGGSQSLLPTPEDVAGYYLIQLSGLIRRVGHKDTILRNSGSISQSEEELQAELKKLEEMRNV